jgi:hypothetical protein
MCAPLSLSKLFTETARKRVRLVVTTEKLHSVWVSLKR